MEGESRLRSFQFQGHPQETNDSHRCTCQLLRVLPNWRAKDLPMHVVHAAQRVLPVPVRSFVELRGGTYKTSFRIRTVSRTCSPPYRYNWPLGQEDTDLPERRVAGAADRIAPEVKRP
jgi:hypothetical protein